MPWGGKELAIGMGTWAMSFLLVGLVAAPLLVKAAGVTVRLLVRFWWHALLANE